MWGASGNWLNIANSFKMIESQKEPYWFDEIKIFYLISIITKR